MATEKRLIDATEYCWELVAERDYPGRTQEFMDAIEVAIADLGDMPTVDAVEVVRCKDCKWFEPNEDIMPQSGSCAYHEMIKMYWDFCSRAKMDGDENG